MRHTNEKKTTSERLSSPEDLNDYLRVTSPATWALLAALVLLLGGMVIWSALASFSTSLTGTGIVENGVMTITFDSEKFAGNVEAGSTVKIGSVEETVKSVGIGENGRTFALADTSLSEGTYSVSVIYRRMKLLEVLLQN